MKARDVVVAALLAVLLGSGWPAAPAGAQEETIQFRGVAEVRQAFHLRLLPGERLVELKAAEGDRIRPGQTLALLANEALAAGLASLVAERLNLREQRRRLELLVEERRLKEKALRRLEARIQSLDDDASGVPDYLRTPPERLIERQEALTERLRLLEIETVMLAEAGFDDDDRELLDRQIGAAQGLVDRLRVKAPFAGRVVNVHRWPQRSSAGELVFALWDDSSLLVRGDVLQHQVAYVQPRSTAYISLDFSDRPPVAGTVQSVGAARPTLDETDYAVFPVIIELDSKPEWLRPGMTVSVRVSIDGAEGDS